MVLIDSFGSEVIANPTIIANTKMLNICPSRYDDIGFFGIMLDTAFGMSSNENPSLISISLSESSYDSLSKEISRRLPGDMIDTSSMAIVIAIVVVITK